MNPFQKLQHDIDQMAKEIAELTITAATLRTHNSTLIEENVTLENALVMADDAISEFCDKCAFQGGQLCKDCPAFNFATNRNLWEA